MTGGKRPLGRPRRRWEDKIKMYVREIVYGGMGYIHLAEDRGQWWEFVNRIMNVRVP
jgi:hypothetical protein